MPCNVPPYSPLENPSLPLAAIYCRVSTRDQADRGFSLPTQLEACLAFAAREGYTVPPEYRFSEDYTGLSLKRPQLMQLRTLIQTRQIHALIVHDADRLSRKLAHYLLLEDELAEHGVALRLVTAPTTDQSPEGALMAHVRGAVAEYELLKFKERARRGRLGRAKEGHPPGGRVSFGYRYVKHPKRGAHYAIAEEEAAIVRRIFDLYVHAKMSQEAIAALFTAEGVPKSFDFHPQFRRKLAVRVWHQSTISAILRNTAYIGTLNYNKKTAIAGKGNADKKTRWQALPEEEWIPIDVPAIITQDLFDAAQEQRKRNATNSSRNRKHAYLFINGRLRCGQCGYAMSGSHTSSGIQYICGRRPYLHFIDPHTRRSVLGTVIEEPVWQDIMAKLKDPQKIATALDHLRHQADDQQITLDQEKDPYLRQLVKCDRELHLAEAAYFGEAMDLSAYKRKTADIALRRQRVEKELARLEEMEQDAARRVAYTDALHTYCARVVQNLTSFDLQEKRDLFETMDIRVTWYPDKPYEITGLLELQIDNKEP